MPPMVQHFQDGELAQAQPRLGQVGSHSLSDRLGGAGERDDQSQRRTCISLGARCGLLRRLSRHSN